MLIRLLPLALLASSKAATPKQERPATIAAAANPQAALSSLAKASTASAAAAEGGLASVAMAAPAKVDAPAVLADLKMLVGEELRVRTSERERAEMIDWLISFFFSILRDGFFSSLLLLRLNLVPQTTRPRRRFFHTHSTPTHSPSPTSGSLGSTASPPTQPSSSSFRSSRPSSREAAPASLRPTSSRAGHRRRPKLLATAAAATATTKSTSSCWSPPGTWSAPAACSTR